MTDDLVKRLRDSCYLAFEDGTNDYNSAIEAADRVETLGAALLEIFDHECRISDRSFIACTARDALWPRAALAGEKKDD